VVSWFLLGRIYCEGKVKIKELDETVDVRDLDKSIMSFKYAAKYIQADAKTGDHAACLQAALIWYFLGSVQFIKAGNDAAWRDYVSQAQRSLEQSWNYFQESRQKLIVRHKIAWCKMLLGNVPGVLQDVKAIILEDPGYYKEAVEKDTCFSSIMRKSHA
jgi:hypothetical protein